MYTVVFKPVSRSVHCDWISEVAIAEKEALRAAGLDHHVQKVESDKGVEIERKQLEETYDDLVFTRQEIKDICIKYDLRFLRTEYFKAALDTEIAGKLKIGRAHV